MTGGRWNAEAAKLGKILRQHRESYGYSQKDIGEALGLSRPIVSNIERGRRRFTAENLLRLAEFYGKPVSVLMVAPVPLPPGMACNVDESVGAGPLGAG